LAENWADVIPEFKGLLAITNQKKRRFGEEQIILQQQNSHLILRARIVSEVIEGRVIGYVVTFDDVTSLLSAQRKAAWSDIARRIAHEIKNPLTPIQLASDRLLKKYRPDDQKAADQFEEYVRIIMRQVDDIGRMVDEFSAFARMPQPEMDRHSLLEIVNGQISLFASKDLSLDVEIDDAKQIIQQFVMRGWFAKRSPICCKMPKIVCKSIMSPRQPFAFQWQAKTI
jgi:two-component system nitrogen regulation sensor histidine kinase NtrY